MIIDTTRIIGRILKGYMPTGIDRVCLEYLKFFKGRTKLSLYLFDRLWLINEKASEEIIVSLLSLDRNALKKNLVKAFMHLTKPDKKDVFFNLSHSGGLEKAEYFNLLKRFSMKKVFMVHDLIPIEHHEFVRPNEYLRHTIRIHNILKSCDYIIVNSNYTKNKLIEYVKSIKFSIDENRIVVNYLGVTHTLIEGNEVNFTEVKEKYRLNDKFFVVISTIEPRKNHIILLYAWKVLTSLLGRETPQLVLIGRRGWECEQVLDFIERGRVSDFVREINECDDSELKTILENSLALLMPSIEEGFGLPVVEAIQLDVLTVCSDIPVFKELYGDIPIYCKWHDASDWIGVVLSILKNRDLLVQRQLERKKTNQHLLIRYNWEKHFETVERLLKSLQ